MAFGRRFSGLWDRESRPPSVRTLAMMGVVGGVSSLLAAAFPANPDAPVALLRVIGVLMLLVSAGLWGLGDRISDRLLQALTVIGILGISLVIARSATAHGAIVASCTYIWLCVYGSFFFSRRVARLQVALMGVAFGIALLVNNVSVPLEGWVFMTASLVLTEETIGRQSSRLRHEAHTDHLTGLLNRKGLVPAVERAFSLADRTGIPVTIALVDLDDFKLVNDREGHSAGDRLLVGTARTWRDALEPSDIIARLGGDEFVVILVGSGEDESARLFEQLRFASPAPWSAGVVSRRMGEDLSACLTRADRALYEVKDTRRARLDPPRSATVTAAAHAEAHLGRS